ncbi:hypothetical protein [Streptomyces rimosus]|uniref:hypothetical protein n=1 Tax=Streptomyces rimosus TaxID=1927 RepID=UPI0004C95854|nr:hypothetical protein [Streptomyces rimosus]
MSEVTQAALDARYTSVTVALRQRLLALAGQLFGATGTYRDADADAFVERVLPVVLGAQRQVGALTDAYLTQMVADMFGGAALARGVELPAALRGTPPEEVYRRPFVTVWTALSQGKPLAEAVRQGRDRLASIAATDLQLARREATRQSLAGDSRVQFYRRFLRGSGNCALCVIASTQRYRKERLMPIHPGCDCGTRPLAAGQDPGQIIDAGLLEDAHTAVAKATGQSDRGGRLPDYRDIIIDRHHGELGELLALRRHDFTGPKDIPGQ